MEVATLTVQNREAKGTNSVRRLRDTGKIPLVLYGGGGDSLCLQADYTTVKRHLAHHLRVFKLELGGKEESGYLQNVQWDCLTDEPLHLDFQRIDMSVPLRMDIELVLLGHPKGLAQGGRLIRDTQHLHLACLPDRVPEQVELRIGHLECGEKILAKDIELPEGCSLDMPADQLIVHLTDPTEVPLTDPTEASLTDPTEPPPADPTEKEI